VLEVPRTRRVVAAVAQLAERGATVAMSSTAGKTGRARLAYACACALKRVAICAGVPVPSTPIAGVLAAP